MNSNNVGLMKADDYRTGTDSATSIPAWLETPPLSQINPPVETRVQELPFGELSWEDFEKLCLRLVRLEANVEHCRLYGVRGQKQEGIDIYARQKFAEKYRVYQCKRVSDFGPAKIKDTVSRFLEGEWASKADMFVLCTKESLVAKERADELEAQSALLREKGITLLPWDSHELSMKLKDLPNLIDDFFGRAWVEAFCGKEQADKLGKRLDAQGVSEFRRRFTAFYRHVFNTHDSGLPIVTLGKVGFSLPLEERYVPPDIYDQRPITILYSPETIEPKVSEDELKNRPFADTTFERSQRVLRSQRPPTAYQQRQSVENWLIAAKRSIVLGGPGSGKSTLLRFVAIDLLQKSPRLTMLSQKWGQFLPVWVPFALWTKMISNPATAACSLSELLHSWLRSWDEERLWPLVEQALEDERLLLLVDGLDEWTDESAARIALDRLRVFIEQRDAPAIVTARPHGFDRLGMQETGWQIGELSDFSRGQQEQLSRIWFTHRMRSLYGDSTSEEHEVERKADAETEGFLTELHRSTDLRELAKVPLLLCLLIYHRFHNTRLPLSRFKAYDSLIEHLISTHPQRRRAAALITDVASELTDDDVKRILARLAYQIQENFGEGLVDHTEAVTVIEDYLRDCDRGFGLEQREVRRYSREVLEIGESTIGLLVRWSPREIGFFHRVFKEYLAAYYLSRMPLTEQLTVIETCCADPQWREVILGLFHLTSRAEDIKQFVDRIKKKLELSNTVDRYVIDLLLCETAFGDFNCSVSLARELAREAFRQIELGSWMPHRERLLQHALDGLRSTQVKELVKAKLKSWFPCRTRWRESIFMAMANWPRVPEVIECLWKGIHDEEPNNQRAAARALADLTAGDSDIGDRVACLARNAVDPKTRAAAIEALLRGWPDHKDIKHILEAARHSMSPELCLVTILGKIQLHMQTEEDWKSLVRLGSWEAGVDYHWRSDVALALMSGWLRSPKTKEACFKALREGRRDWQRIEQELALRILLDGYPQDEDVAQFCVNEIKHQEYPFLLLHFEAWHLLSQNFRDYPQIVEALDEWIPKQEYREPEIAMAAMVGRTPKAKAKLLSSLSSSTPHWPAGALIEGWGMEDAEVATGLTQVAFGRTAEASRIGYLLPEIIEDRAKCRSRLLELLRDPKCARPDFVMMGLVAQGNTQDDTEVVDTVLNLSLEREALFHGDVIGRLITGYSSNQRVKELAKQELSKRDGNCSAVAWSYGSDEEIRRTIIDMACPLPVRLRRVIATRLGEGSADDSFVMSLLKLYDHEPDEEVKTQTSIGYHTRLKALGQDTGPAVETLSQSIVCYGFDHRERRQAAFCGLVILDRLDVMVNAKERIGSNRLCAISTTSRGLSPNVPLLKLILQNWDDIKAALGDEFWPRLSKMHSDPLGLWDEFCMFADEYPSPREEALRFLEYRTERTAKPNILRFLGRVRPKSHLLLEYCLKALCIGDRQRDCSGEEAVVAAELLGAHFGGDDDVLTRIISGGPRKHVYEKMILALCEGWPETEELEHVFEIVREQRRPLSYATYFRLICRKGSSEFVFDSLTRELPRFSEFSRLRDSQVIIQPILRRLGTDESLCGMLTERLRNSPTPSEKATVPKLIGTARGLSSELRNWCIEEADRQLRSEESPEIGVDLVIGKLRPVAHSLLDVVYRPSWIQS
jgi:hypothetical protein